VRQGLKASFNLPFSNFTYPNIFGLGAHPIWIRFASPSRHSCKPKRSTAVQVNRQKRQTYRKVSIAFEKLPFRSLLRDSLSSPNSLYLLEAPVWKVGLRASAGWSTDPIPFATPTRSRNQCVDGVACWLAILAEIMALDDKSRSVAKGGLNCDYSFRSGPEVMRSKMNFPASSVKVFHNHVKFGPS